MSGPSEDEDESNRLWIDVLNRKHECGPAYGDTISIEVVHEGERYTIQMPDMLDDPERLEIRATVRSERHFVLIAHHTFADPKYPHERGILMVGKNVGERTYAVHVWHELYPWALKYLGIDGLSASDGD